jgi:hypothetical protein
MSVCDLSTGDLFISLTEITCANLSLPFSSTLTVTGTTSAHQIQIEDFPKFDLSLSNLVILGDLPISITNSTVTITSSGTNYLRSSDSPAVSCAGNSSLTFSAVEDGLLYAIGGSYAPGIGAPTDEVCESLTFINGSYAVNGSRGAAIGAGYNESRVGEIVIEDGVFVIGADLAAGIGSGYSDGGISSVGKVVFQGGNFSIVASNGAWIGSGYGRFGRTAVSSVYIEDGYFNLTTWIGSPIGVGHANEGDSMVDNVTIVDGFFKLFPCRGAGIGSGYSTYGRASLGTLVILNGTFISGHPVFGAGIGSGYSLEGTSEVDSITIVNGSFDLIGSFAAGIGSGTGFVGEASVGSVRIVDGTFVLTGYYGSAIGTGAQNSTVANVTIENGDFSAVSVHANGIGDGSDIFKPVKISLRGGRFNVTGVVALGSQSGSVGFDQATALRLNLQSQTPDFSLQALAFGASGSPVFISTNTTRLFAPAIETVSLETDIIVRYAIASEREFFSGTGVQFVAVPNLPRDTSELRVQIGASAPVVFPFRWPEHTGFSAFLNRGATMRVEAVVGNTTVLVAELTVADGQFLVLGSPTVVFTSSLSRAYELSGSAPLPPYATTGEKSTNHTAAIVAGSVAGVVVLVVIVVSLVCFLRKRKKGSDKESQSSTTLTAVPLL